MEEAGWIYRAALVPFANGKVSTVAVLSLSLGCARTSSRGQQLKRMESDVVEGDT